MASIEYVIELKSYKSDFENVPFIESGSSSLEEVLKHHKNAYDLLQTYLENQLQAIENFKLNWDIEEQIKFLMNYESHSLTNGKFYDYAVGLYAWGPKHKDLYQLIESKINIFFKLKNKLQVSFKDFILKHHDKYLRLISPEIAIIIEIETQLGNKVISSYNREYLKQKMFLQLNSDFNKDYKEDYPNLEYKHINDIHYWNKEYQDNYTILVSGFGTNITNIASG